MRTHYYCLMDIPNHPLRVKGLEYLQQKGSQEEKKDAKMEICTCPKCGIQLYRPSGATSSAASRGCRTAASSRGTARCTGAPPPAAR